MGARVDYSQIAELHRLGYSARQIAERLGCDPKTVHRWRRAQGLTTLPENSGYPVTPERLEAARLMFADGASRHDVSLTLRMHEGTLRRYFPGTAWTFEESGRMSQMVQHLNRIEALA